jgi:hypothetical protein
MTSRPKGLLSNYDDIWLLDGVRTAFADYNTVLGLVSPIDLGIKVAREVFRRSGVSPADVDTVIAGNMAQVSFDAYMLPRHIGIYSGVPIEVPAHLAQRVCGTGIEVILQSADLIKLGKADLALGVGTESMSRNPIAAYTHRGGFRMGQVEFKDFLWEALLDPACILTMGKLPRPWPSNTKSRARRLTPSPQTASRAPWLPRKVASSAAKLSRWSTRLLSARDTLLVAFVCRVRSNPFTRTAM